MLWPVAWVGKVHEGEQKNQINNVINNNLTSLAAALYHLLSDCPIPRFRPRKRTALLSTIRIRERLLNWDSAPGTLISKA